MINFGFWQLNRLDERKASNAVVTDAMKQQPQPLSTVLPAGPAATTEQVKAADYQPVYVTGVYLVEAQVLVTNRTNNGAPGYWVVTPLVQADGTGSRSIGVGCRTPIPRMGLGKTLRRRRGP